MRDVVIPRLSQLDGQVIVPGDAGYDDARTVFVGGIDRRPAAIVRAAHEGDVAHVVRIAAETDMELAVRSGGHSGAGHSVSEGGIALDLSNMNALDIDPVARTAWAGSGSAAAASASSCASTASRSTTCWPPTS